MASDSGELATAIDLHQAGRLQDAEQVYRRILNSDPQDPRAWHLLGVISWQSGKQELAVEYIMRALELRPDYAEANANLGNVLKEQGKLDQAISYFRLGLIETPASRRELGF